MNQDEMAVAHNLKHMRSQRNLSLDQLAELTGVSKSMLRQIETGRSSPTIATLWKIANGLHVSFTNLVSRPRAEVAIMDWTGAEPWTAEKGRYRLYPLVPFDPRRGFELYHLQIDPGVTYLGEPHEGEVEEFVFVNQGSIRIRVDQESYQAGPGQLMRFVANRPHSYSNMGSEMVSLNMMICYLG